MPGPEEASLIQCLADTRKALVAADMNTLARLSADIETALSSLGRLGRDDLRSIRAAAETNGQLLEAALKGIKAARRRASELTDPGRFSTYEAGGRRQQHGLSSGNQTVRL